MEHLISVLSDLRRATNAALSLAEQLAAARVDGDEWLRFPRPEDRCPISGFSRSKIDRLARARQIRRKTVGKAAFYSGADMRRLLSA
jgi:hypothetical protein